MPEPTEFEDQNGDLWIVRECEADVWYRRVWRHIA